MIKEAVPQGRCERVNITCIPTVLAISSAKLRRVGIMLRNAMILSVAKREFGKFFRMQYAGKNFDAVDNTRPRARVGQGAGRGHVVVTTPPEETPTMATILVVEDDENWDMISRRLQRRGYIVVQAADGQ